MRFGIQCFVLLFLEHISNVTPSEMALSNGEDQELTVHIYVELKPVEFISPKYKIEMKKYECLEVPGRIIITGFRFQPCFFSKKYPQFGGQPWYWTDAVKPLRWDLFYNQ